GAMKILLRNAVGQAAPGADRLATLAVLGAAAAQLLVPHLEESETWAGTLGLVGYVPAAFFVLTQGVTWAAAHRRPGVSSRQAGDLFLGLGMTGYALAVAFGFILYRTEDVPQALEYLAVPLALAGLPLLLGGTITSAKLAVGEEPSDGGTTGLPRGVAAALATMVGLAGTLVLLLALGAAWPNPVRLTVVASINAVALAVVAHRFRLAPGSAPAQVCLALAVLTGYHAVTGALAGPRPELGGQVLASWYTPASGLLLLGLAALLAG